MEEKNIIVTTTDLKENYEILGSLYVTEKIAVIPNEKETNKVLSVIIERIKRQCMELGGDAVICCRFSAKGEHSLSISGTAVKIKPKS